MQNSIKQLSEQHGWNQIQKARAIIATYSLQKAAVRVINQKQQETKDSLEKQQEFNLKISKEVFYEKVATQYGDANSVTRGLFSAKGNLYITVGSSGQGYVWNTADPNVSDFCQKITSLTAPSKLCGVDFHPRIGYIPGSGPNIITGSTTGDLQIWTYLPERQAQKSISRPGHEDRINDVKFLESGSHFVTASYDKSWILWDGKKISKIFSQKGHEKQIHTVGIHPDQSLVFTGDLGGFGMLWDLRTGKGVYQLRQTDSLLCSDFAPNGFEVAVAGKNNIISIFDLRRKKELKRIPAHLKLISDIKYQQDGLYLGSASHDNTVRLWHGYDYTPIPIQDIQEQHKITSIDFRQGRLAITGIDRKWSMFINKSKWREKEQPKLEDC